MLPYTASNPFGPTSDMATSPRRRALIVKFGSIGDVVMAIPGAAALHCEGFTVDWVVSAAIAPVLALYPWIHGVPVSEPQLLRGSWSEKLAAIRALRAQLRSRVRLHGPYDLLATLYYDRRYDLLTRGIPARERLLLSRTDRRFALLPGRHHTDEYARILLGVADGERPAGIAPVPPPVFPLPSSPASARIPLVHGDRIVLIPGGARNTLRDDALRRWPVHFYVDLARRLLLAGFEVVLAGGPEDHWTTPHFDPCSQGATSARFTNTIGQLGLVETLSLFHSAAVTVTHDTGPLHLAGLTRTAIVSIFGPTDPHGRLPRRENALALWGGEGFSCRPCYDGRDYAPCLHNGCMSQITPEAVFAEVIRLHTAQSAGAPLQPEVRTPIPSPYVQLDAAGPR